MNTSANLTNIPVYKNKSLKNLPKEVWKELKDEKKGYFISNKGRIKSTRLAKPRIAKINYKGRRYLTVGLSVNGKPKTFDVHRLVAENFCKGHKKGFVVNHIDGNKENNCFENLEWCSQSDNMNHAFRTGLIDKSKLGVKNHKRARKLTEEQVIDIKENKGFGKASKLSKKHNISTATIYRIWGGYIWKDVNI